MIAVSYTHIDVYKRQAYYIDISERNCNRLLNLVNNILDNTKLQSKMYTLNLKEVDIIYLVEETSLTLIDYIKSKSIELIICLLYTSILSSYTYEI